MTKPVTLYIRIFTPIAQLVHEAFTHALVCLGETKEPDERKAHALAAKHLYGKALVKLTRRKHTLGNAKQWQLLKQRCERELNSVNSVLEQLKDSER